MTEIPFVQGMYTYVGDCLDDIPVKNARATWDSSFPYMSWYFLDIFQIQSLISECCTLLPPKAMAA